MNSLSVIILTFNEELNLPKCLEALKALDAPIFVVDSFSSDNTLSLCGEYNVSVFQNKFETHSKQWEYALTNLPIRTDWVLGIDADQELLPELVGEIKDVLNKNPKVDGFYIKRRNYFTGKWIKHGGYYPRYLLKLFRKDKVYLDPGELMDHHFYVKGTTGKLEHDLIENNLKEDLNFWSQKHIRYAALQATEEFNSTATNNGYFWGNPDDRRLVLKSIWNRIPLFIRPFLYFMYRYFFQMGFLDGKTGLIFHFLQAFWYRFLVDAKIYELRKTAKRKNEYQS